MQSLLAQLPALKLNQREYAAEWVALARRDQSWLAPSAEPRRRVELPGSAGDRAPTGVGTAG